jgi:E3 ubiquitin-protein ligase SHPRH
MVERTVSGAARLACSLVSVHRWCVTGTPIRKTLLGLFTFLGVEPYCRSFVMEHLEAPESGILLSRILQRIMWRSTKSSVRDELGIPPRSEEVITLPLSTVEQAFYKRQLRDVAAHLEGISKVRALP